MFMSILTSTLINMYRPYILVDDIKELAEDLMQTVVTAVSVGEVYKIIIVF